MAEAAESGGCGTATVTESGGPEPVGGGGVINGGVISGGGSNGLGDGGLIMRRGP